MLHLGNNLDVLKTFTDNSIDSIVTDPPYGLSFMGKKWDYDVPSKELWIECLRVLKPGGHLLSFGGTRTYHRTVVAIEDAGFEIRDQIQWIYGSGFPKSHNLKDEWQGWGTALKPANEIVCMARKPLTGKDELNMLVRELCQSQLFANVAKKILESNQSESNEALNIVQWLAGESTLTQDALFTLMDMSQSESVKSSNLSIEYSWLSILAEILALESTFTIETASSLITDLKILRSLLSKITQESIIQAETNQHGQLCNVLLARNLFFAVSTKLRFILTPSVLESVTSKDIVLSPNSEPICVARKPLSESTVAKNVLKYGTGGLNIEASRIAAGDDLKPAFSGAKGQKQTEYGDGTVFGNSDKYESVVSPFGRWPANVIFDEDAASVLDEQSGILKSGAMKNVKSTSLGYHGNKKGAEWNHEGSSGGASRFFYVAKASKRERGEGNNHPTVKPIKLMEYLIKLVTPPNGTVLDPFMGSGSTGVAAKNLGFNFVGIELNEEYFEIAKRRYEFDFCS